MLLELLSGRELNEHKKYGDYSDTACFERHESAQDRKETRNFKGPDRKFTDPVRQWS